VENERERQTDRQTERQRDRERERAIERKRKRVAELWTERLYELHLNNDVLIFVEYTCRCRPYFPDYHESDIKT